MPLSCLWYELKWHGYGPDDALELVVLKALRGGGFDFWKLRARIRELTQMPAPVVEAVDPTQATSIG